jgi:hypothetical protein
LHEKNKIRSQGSENGTSEDDSQAFTIRGMEASQETGNVKRSVEQKDTDCGMNDLYFLSRCPARNFISSPLLSFFLNAPEM